MRKKLLIVGAVVALILLIDQCLKIWIKTHLQEGESINLIGDWFNIHYTENQGMAFGTTFGAGIWAKLTLSIFRIIAICGIAYYVVKQAREGVKTEFLIAMGFIFAGATGNLIDSVCYDFIFPYDPCAGFNRLEGSGIISDCGVFGQVETRHTGFLLGNVVDMFIFDAQWPSWLPWLGGKSVFPAIWNIADASITTGVLMVLFRQRKYFPKKRKALSGEARNAGFPDDAGDKETIGE